MAEKSGPHEALEETGRIDWVCAPDPASAITAAAERLAASLRRFTAPRLAIPGGSALAALAPARLRIGPLWSSLRLTWVDERRVSPDHDDSNRGAAQRSGALDPSQPPARELPLHLAGESSADAVVRVGAALASDFDGGLDVSLLGMGEDGHVASLFPGQSALSGSVAHVVDSPKPPAERITLTRPTLASARVTLLLVLGESKRKALERLAEGDPSLPAHGLPGTTVVSDQRIGGSR